MLLQLQEEQELVHKMDLLNHQLGKEVQLTVANRRQELKKFRYSLVFLLEDKRYLLICLIAH